MANEVKALTINGTRRTIKDETARTAAAAAQNTANSKQNALIFDTAPQSGSTNPVTSGGIYTALQGMITEVPIATEESLGTVMPDGETITIDEDGVISATGGGSEGYTLPIASTSQLGGVKIDGDTIVIDSNGVISGTGGGSEGYTLPEATQSTLGGVRIGEGLSVSDGTISNPTAVYGPYSSGYGGAYIGSVVYPYTGVDTFSAAFTGLDVTVNYVTEGIGFGGELYYRDGDWGDSLFVRRTGARELTIELVRRTALVYLDGTQDAWDTSMSELTKMWELYGQGTPTDSDLLDYFSNWTGNTFSTKADAIAATDIMYVRWLNAPRRVILDVIQADLTEDSQYGPEFAFTGQINLDGGSYSTAYENLTELAAVKMDAPWAYPTVPIDNAYVKHGADGKLTLDIQAVKDAIDALTD